MKNQIKWLLLLALALASPPVHAKAKAKSRTAGGLNCQNPQGNLQCMTCNCFNEAGNQKREGQLAVGKVVMTRVGLKGYPKSVCGVIKQPNQFSWFNKKSTRQNVPANHGCHKVAAESLKFRGYFADHYYASYIRQPRWARKMRGVGSIGTHRFYSAHAPTQNLQYAQSQAMGVASLLISLPALQGLITLPGDAT